MKYYLLLDSSNVDLVVGLANESGVIDRIVYQAWQKQSEKMIEEIDKILYNNKVLKEDLAGISVSKGPGSYTGIRVALTIAKTMSFALNIPLYLVSSLEVLKDNKNPSICLMNARSKRSYIGVYNGSECVLSDSIFENDKVLEYINNHKDYKVYGDTKYLGVEGTLVSVLDNLFLGITDKNKCEDSLAARPIYLKDSSLDSSMKITIRKMIASDVSTVHEIGKKCFEDDAYTEESIRYDLLENPVAQMLVATVNAEVVGYLDFMITFNSATINQIAVKDDFRNKGVGNLLIGEMIKICKQQEDPVENITLEVRVSNENAHKFYKKHAFKDITTKKHYYSNGEDATYMVRSIIND